MSQEYKVHYFDARGLAEPLRLILSYAGAEWEDARFPISLPVPTIPEEIKKLSPYGQVPLLEFDGQIMSQSSAAARFLARKFNLVGANDLESAKCDEIVDAAKDFLTLFLAVYKEKDEEKKVEIKAQAVKDSRNRYISKFNELLEASGGHFVGEGLTWADIYVAHAVNNMQRIHEPLLIDGFSAVEQLIESVFNEPGIKEWIAKRPDTQF